jgi:hypothetical protein
MGRGVGQVFDLWFVLAVVGEEDVVFWVGHGGLLVRELRLTGGGYGKRAYIHWKHETTKRHESHETRDTPFVPFVPLLFHGQCKCTNSGLLLFGSHLGGKKDGLCPRL